MKHKSILIVFILSLFFLGTHSSSIEPSDTLVVTYEFYLEVSEQIEETEDNRSFLQSNLQLSHFIIDSSAIIFNSTFSLSDNFIDIEKPPIIS